MPKIRTRKSAAKRIRVTGSGKVKRMREFSGCHHIREKKSPKRTRKFRKATLADASDIKRLKVLAPYAF
ncbi:MAG: 50S ribosomal protein L35 [Candidatus Eremiobacterota bacterium]